MRGWIDNGPRGACTAFAVAHKACPARRSSPPPPLTAQTASQRMPSPSGPKRAAHGSGPIGRRGGPLETGNPACARSPEIVPRRGEGACGSRRGPPSSGAVFRHGSSPARPVSPLCLPASRTISGTPEATVRRPPAFRPRIEREKGEKGEFRLQPRDFRTEISPARKRRGADGPGACTAPRSVPGKPRTKWPVRSTSHLDVWIYLNPDGGVHPALNPFILIFIHQK